MHVETASFSTSTSKRILFFQYAIIILEIIAIISRASGINLFTDTGVHHFWSDVFFVNYTFLGDGWFAFFLVCYLAYKRSPVWKKMALVAALTMIFIQLIKNSYAGGEWQLYFEEGQYLHFVNPDQMAGRHIPVSGHTAMAFALAGVWASMLKYRTQVITLAAGAVLVAVSRMYLAGNGLTALTIGAAAGLFSVAAVETGLSLYKRTAFNMAAPGKNSLPSGNVLPA